MGGEPPRVLHVRGKYRSFLCQDLLRERGGSVSPDLSLPL
jgi:hypothetical protein